MSCSIVMSPLDASTPRAISGRAFVLATAFVLIAGCSGKVIDHGGVSDQGSCGPIGPTTSCASCSCEGTQWVCAPVPNCVPEAGTCIDGQTRSAGDACNNTCTCSSGRWRCTDLGCVTPTCKPGDERAAGDGCNVCACDDDGTWDCTQKLCPLPRLDASTASPCDASDPQGRGHAVIAGCPCSVLPGDYCCSDGSHETGYACNNRAWARFFDSRCGGVAPDAGLSAPVAGTITCGP